MAATSLHLVGFRIGRETFGVPISLVHEIVRVPEITAVPEAPDFVEGVINLRGKIVSIVDLRKRFGEKEITQHKKNRILVELTKVLQKGELKRLGDVATSQLGAMA
jgi:purine-binding chemotaxis protein CheW